MSRYLPVVLFAIFSMAGRPEPALASPILPTNWIIEDARFDDGGTLSGHFLATEEALTGTFHHFRVDVQGGTTPQLPSLTYGPATDSQFDWTGLTLSFIDYAIGPSFGHRLLLLQLAGPLTEAGGIVTFDLASSYEESYASRPTIKRYLVSGRVVGVPRVPEPTILVLTGIAAALAYRRHRRRA